MYPFYCYKKCGTCKKARAFLDKHNIEYHEIDIKTAEITPEEITGFHKKSGKPIKHLFNTSGQVYRDLNLKEKLDKMSDKECYELLSSNGMLIKRPILVDEHKVYIGFKEREYEELIDE